MHLIKKRKNTLQTRGRAHWIDKSTKIFYKVYKKNNLLDDPSSINARLSQIVQLTKVMKFMLIVIITMGAMGHDPKTIEMRIPQENKEECLKSAKTFELKLPIPGIMMSMKSRCEPKSDEEEPEVKQVGA